MARLVIVDHGLVIAAGTPAELKREVAGDVVSLRVPGTDEAARVLDGLPYTREVKADRDLLRVYLDDGERALPHLLATLAGQGLALESVALDRATLDDVFLHKTGRSLRDAAGCGRWPRSTRSTTRSRPGGRCSPATSRAATWCSRSP
ncbi:DUF4162 domain-containing protein [Microbispora rosea]|uniref:DUF4162 domain-containing protein n=1 Tax=Microbispora rosea TaxID=58117 RepID=UPI003F4E17F1